ncbi:hypothetical protein HI914_04510 [Erysiphe necator]|uniref:Putative copper resistance protein crd2 n=1 Tax=Uncinula necator TaxID=52586 RepID=A0A0B1P8J0_UNCNE|nr:hypothetical protein HI914_04510 [Erysiphe necator]KHJ34573.1 putative copper resistance protein crd2 [Erysiphe necator]
MGLSTCCRRNGETCLCATQAKCSCGKKSALRCDCDKAQTENSIRGPRCSCRARPARACTCERAHIENSSPEGNLCPCGIRPADSCSCEEAKDGGLLPSEIDFTTRV